MRAAAEVQGATVAQRFGATAGEVTSEFRSEAVTCESGAAVEDAAGRQLSGSERERFSFRESRIREEPSTDSTGPGVGSDAGAQDAFHQVRPADAGFTGRQAGPAAEPGDQTARPL